jgi:hypothetical protein
MANGRISDYLAEKWLSEIVTGHFVALHHDNPDVAGAYASEVVGGGYARQPIQFVPPNNRAIFNLTAIQWNGLPGVTVTHLALWDALINGNYTASIELDIAVRVLPGRSLGYGASVLAFSLD